MTYILIFISAVFVNNIVLSQFLGICPFRRFEKIDTALGMSGAVAFVMTIATIFTYIIQKQCWNLSISVFADHYVYPDYCSVGAVGRNYSEKGFAGALPGFGCISSPDYYQLYYSGRCDYGYPERF